MLRHGALLSLLFVSSSGAATAPLAPIRFDAAVAEEGDILFRRGRSLTSRAVLAGDGGAFSHVGIVIYQDGAPWVVHAVPDGVDGEGGTRADPLEVFLQSDRASDAALYRIPAGQAARRDVAQAAAALLREARPFDDALDNSDASALYCTELVAVALQSAGSSVGEIPLRQIRLLGIERQILAPGDLARALEPVPAFRAPVP